jgi:hypothetical protein
MAVLSFCLSILIEEILAHDPTRWPAVIIGTPLAYMVDGAVKSSTSAFPERRYMTPERKEALEDRVGRPITEDEVKCEEKARYVVSMKIRYPKEQKLIDLLNVENRRVFY